jgi:hypothetical protein
MKRKFASLLILFYWTTLSAQNFRNDIIALRENFEESYEMKINTVILSNDPNYSKLQLSGYLKVSKNLMHFKQGDEEVLHAKNYMLLISHANKNIIVDTATTTYNAAPLYFLNIDTLISNYKKITFSQANNKKTYTIIPINGNIKSFTITIGIAGYLEKVVMSLTDNAGGGNAIITYTQFKKNPPFSKDEFSPWFYIKESKGRFIPQALFKNYTIDTLIRNT